MRVVHARRDPQGGGAEADREDQPGPARAQQHQSGGQRDGQGRVVAGERPVPGRRALGESGGRQTGQRAAGPFLVDHDLQCLARRVREDRAEAGERHARDRTGVPSPPRRPPAEHQQQAQHQQSGLGRGLQQPDEPVRCVGDGVRHPPVAGGRGAGDHPDRLVAATALGRQNADQAGPQRRKPDREGHPRTGRPPARRPPARRPSPVRSLPGRSPPGGVGPARSVTPAVRVSPDRFRHDRDGRSSGQATARPESQTTTPTIVRVDARVAPYG